MYSFERRVQTLFLCCLLPGGRSGTPRPRPARTRWAAPLEGSRFRRQRTEGHCPRKREPSSTLFHTIADALDLPPIALRDLRHGAATLALAAGADLKAVQELLGHATITLTADTYTHLLPELASDIAENVVRLIPRRRTQGDDDRDGPPAAAVAGRR